MGTLTLIDICREHAARRALPRPALAAGSTDAGEAQYCGLMNEMMDDITTRKSFRFITREKVHTSLAASLQGDIYTLTDAGFLSIEPDTFWNRTSGLKVRFALTPQEWQSRQVNGTASGPSYSARLRMDNLYIDPAPPAGQSFSWEYRTTFGVLTGPSWTTYKQYFTRDDDKCFLPDKVCLAWLNYAWKREKGFEHAAAERSYEMALGDAMAVDLQSGPAQMAGRCETQWGVIVPEGSWPLV